MKIAVVTDSTCDLPPSLATKNGIHIVPVNLTIGHETYRDRHDLTRDAFYELLPALPELPTTSAPAPGVFETLYCELLDYSDAIVSLHAAATLSATYAAARVGAEATGESERITVIDSGQLSMGLGWAVLAASEASRGVESLQVVLARIRETLKRVRVLAIFNTMEYLHRSGRVGWLRANAGDTLHLKPMFQLRDGEVLARGQTRRWPKAVSRLAEVLNDSGPLDRLAILHAQCRPCVNNLISMLEGPLPNERPSVVEVTPVIGVHVGPHALGAAAVLAPDTH